MAMERTCKRLNLVLRSQTDKDLIDFLFDIPPGERSRVIRDALRVYRRLTEDASVREAASLLAALRR